MTQEPQDRVELTFLGQLLSVTGSHILPLLLVLMLFANTVLMAIHIRAMNETISDAIKGAAAAAAEASAQIRIEQSARQHEHSEIVANLHSVTGLQTQQITQTLIDQNTHFDMLITSGQNADAISYARLERVITRTCRAREKEFTMLADLLFGKVFE